MLDASRFYRRCHFAAALLLAGTATAAIAQNNDPPQLHTHQSYIENVLKPAALDVKDPMAVFAYVLNSLPDRVKVYPTENYFYFTFELNGSPFAGNIRLDASDRDQGKVQFGYFEQTSGWRDDTPTHFEVLDGAKGVKLEKVERFLYRLSYGGKSVLFELNDLSQVRPPSNALAPGERFIGPIFDDSGIRFFLIYNPAIKNFLYVLDETVAVADDFFAGPRSDRIVIGKRSGFVFYRDDRRERKILIGVYEENVRVNNYFDGPFDQLPDNFIDGEALRSALLEIDPKLKGRIDRFGGTPDGEVRFMIAPYKLYRELAEVDGVPRCAARKASSDATYYRCFILDHTPQDLNMRPANADTSRQLK
ncbi:MAG: hypothetical protein WDN48_13115 [Pseudolabrys sp.]